MKQLWWKLLGALMVIYSVIAGMLMEVPALNILNESIRNLFYHVPMWFAMIALLVGSTVYSIGYLIKPVASRDIRAAEITRTAVFLGILGLITGMVWAQYTWGRFWTNDPKLNGVAIAMLVYLAYLVLRSAIEEPEKRARVAAVFNVFAFPVFIVLIFILPRLQDSLHPGNGGNPGFNAYDLQDSMRPVFYTAVTGWILVGFWIASLRTRIKKLELKDEDSE